MPRERLSASELPSKRLESKGGAYFTRPNTEVEFIPTGCKVLDLALGGGWAQGRIANILGDKAVGKTLLAIEAGANFIKKFPDGIIRYREAEAAFDEPYAEALGLPLESCDFGDQPLETIEDLFNDFNECMKSKKPQLYILDSLDALSDKAEMERGIDEGTYGVQKAKLLGQFFRRNVRLIESRNITVLIISQIRDKIGFTGYGKKTTRSGGRALDFYASQVVFLTHLGMVNKTVSGLKRPIAAEVKAKVEKNKVSMPYREVDFEIHFGYGIDDEKACLSFAKQVKLDVSTCTTMKQLRAAVSQRWYELEKQFIRKERKYG